MGNHLRDNHIWDNWSTTSLKSQFVYVLLDLSLPYSHLSCVLYRRRKHTSDLWYYVLKFLSLRINGFYFPVSVTGFLSKHYLNASISLGKFRPFNSLSSLTKSGSLSSVFLTYRLMILSFPILSNDCTCVSSFS